MRHCHHSPGSGIGAPSPELADYTITPWYRIGENSPGIPSPSSRGGRRSACPAWCTRHRPVERPRKCLQSPQRRVTDVIARPKQILRPDGCFGERSGHQVDPTMAGDDGCVDPVA